MMTGLLSSQGVRVARRVAERRIGNILREVDKPYNECRKQESRIELQVNGESNCCLFCVKSGLNFKVNHFLPNALRFEYNF